MKTTLLILINLAFALDAQAGSATWSLNPTSDDWNTAANWMPNTVPNGPDDTASFSTSEITDVKISAPTILAASIYEPNADGFTISTKGLPKLTFTGIGIINNSTEPQSFVVDVDEENRGGRFLFKNRAAITGAVNFTVKGQNQYDSQYPSVEFHNYSSAGTATFFNEPGLGDGRGGIEFFFDFASAGSGHFICESATADGVSGQVYFADTSSAGNATFTVNGDGTPSGVPGYVFFTDSATADHGTFTLNGSTVSGARGGSVVFLDTSTGGDGTIIVNGSDVPGAAGGELNFDGHTGPGNSTIIVNGGDAVGGNCGLFDFGIGGTASVSVFGNGTLTVGGISDREVSIGSLGGDGNVIIVTTETLMIGSNGRNTRFDGIIQGPGKLTKVGTGTLKLSGANIYTGRTIVSAGSLVIENTTGSGTGTGAVEVDAGILGGRGIIAGAVTVGTGSGAGAFLAPAVGTKAQTTLIIQSGLTLGADATYTYTFKARGRKSKTDQVIADGVAINSGATLSVQGITQDTLRAGLVLTVISNTSANPIAGTFNNLPDGAIVTVNGNNFQANYEGGDGNDLTLTVVP